MSNELICENILNEVKYKYFLIESFCNIECIGCLIRYGIKIDSYDNDDNLIDTKEVFDVFGNKVKMIKAIKLLKKLEVTPITLEDIVLDNIY